MPVSSLKQTINHCCFHQIGATVLTLFLGVARMTVRIFQVLEIFQEIILLTRNYCYFVNKVSPPPSNYFSPVSAEVNSVPFFPLLRPFFLQ